MLSTRLAVLCCYMFRQYQAFLGKHQWKPLDNSKAYPYNTCVDSLRLPWAVGSPHLPLFMHLIVRGNLGGLLEDYVLCMSRPGLLRRKS
jgi:hypothetical protein